MNTQVIVVFCLLFAAGSVLADSSVESVTRHLEKGNGSILEKELDKHCLEDRIVYLKEVDLLNLKHREADSKTPDLVVRITTTKVGSVRFEVERKLPGFAADRKTK